MNNSSASENDVRGAAPADRSETNIPKLANHFILVLSEWLTPEQIAEVNRRNDA